MAASQWTVQGYCQWCYIILCWFPDNTAGIVTRRSGFQWTLQDLYILPVVVEDSGYPAQSSTATLTIRVCSCEAGGSLLTCSAEAIFLPVGLSTGALMAILLCVALLIGKLLLHDYNTVVYTNTKTLLIKVKPTCYIMYLTIFVQLRFSLKLRDGMYWNLF